MVIETGNAKRTDVAEYRVQGRGGLGIKVAADSEQRGDLVGAVMVRDGDEVLVVMEKGKVVRSRVDDVGVKGRDTQGVRFARPTRVTRSSRSPAATRPWSRPRSRQEVAAEGEASTDGVAPAEARADGVPSDPGDQDAGGESSGGEA